MIRTKDILKELAFSLTLGAITYLLWIIYPNAFIYIGKVILMPLTF